MSTLLESFALLEGITHLEDLSSKEFINTVETLKDKIITEKLDGANLWFGIDDNGLFTSREGKSPKKGRFYDVSDYPMVANYNGFRAVHLALEKAEPVISKVLVDGDMIEIEVLFGRQPNTVTYGAGGKNYVVILRGVNGTPEVRVNKLAKVLNHKTVTIESTIVSSPDGDELVLNDESITWEFTNVEPMKTDKIDTSGVTALIKQMKQYLGRQNKVVAGKTNEEVSELSLNTIPKEKREEAKEERNRVNAELLSEFKGPIKEILLGKFVRSIKPALQDKKLDPSEDIGVEGVVVRDPVTGNQTKIVDKDVFTAINSFNSASRNSVAGLVRTTDQDATAEMRGGVFGQAKIRIAELLGAKELAMSSGVKRFITKFKGSNPQDTANKIASSLNIEHFDGVKQKVVAILKNAVYETNQIVQGFKDQHDEYKIKLKTGKEMGISPEIMKRTLTAFAETKKDIAEITARVAKAKDPTQLVLALYGKTVESIFDGEDVKESYNLLKSINEDDAGGAAPAGAVGGTEAQMADPKSYVSKGTNAGAIGTNPNMLMKGGRMITRRARKFQQASKFPVPKPGVGSPTAEGKFSLLKSMNEDWAHVKDMKFATDVDDSAKAQQDVEFNNLRNNVNIGNDVTSMDVGNYLDKAHELNDEVDTVTFGMETDDGKVAKVFVNATQADDFEKALADMLGEKDDLEEVINELANKFDIVDVEWPEGYGQESEVNPEGDDAALDVDADGSEEGDIDLSLASDEDSTEEEPEPEADADLTDDSTDDESDDSTDDIPADDSSNPEDTPPEEDADLTGDSTDDESDDESSELELPDDSEEETNDDGTPKKKKKKKAAPEEEPTATEESMQTLGQRFKNKVLAEAKKPVEKEVPKKEEPKSDEATDQLNKLLMSFPTKGEKAVITLMASLGTPIRAMSLHKGDLKKGIEDSADMYMKNSSFKMWTKKLLASITSADVKEGNFDDRLSNKYQHVIYGILKALGIPQGVVISGQRPLLTGIKTRAKLAMSNSNMRVYLMAVAEELGIDAKVRNMPENEEGIKEDFVIESPEDGMAPVKALLAALGFDLNANRSIESQSMRPNSRGPLSKLAANPMLVNKLNLLATAISTKVSGSNSTPTPNQAPAGPSTPAKAQSVMQGLTLMGQIIAEEKDDSNWIIAKMGAAGLTLTKSGVKIKVSDEEAQKLILALEKHRKISVIAKDHERYVFTPGKHGTFDVSKLDDDGSFPEDMTIDADQVEEIKDLLSD